MFETTRLNLDEHATLARDKYSVSMFDYQVQQRADFRAIISDEKLFESVVDKQNLRISGGYGTNPSLIDTDSMLRENALSTNTREKTQYNIRTFHAVPDYSRGAAFPVIESILQNGDDATQSIKICERVTEKDFQRFIPLIQPMQHYIDNGKKGIPTIPSIGQSSKDLMRKEELLVKKGYTFDGRNWLPNC